MAAPVSDSVDGAAAGGELAKSGSVGVAGADNWASDTGAANGAGSKEDEPMAGVGGCGGGSKGSAAAAGGVSSAGALDGVSKAGGEGSAPPPKLSGKRSSGAVVRN